MNTNDHYTDIFDERPDASFERRIEQLAALYKAGEPLTQLSWRQLQLQMRKKNGISSKQHKMALNWMRPKPRVPLRPVLAMGMLISLLLLSGFAYATLNLGLLNTIFTAEPASQQLLQTNQFTILQQRQIVDGYQVTLDKGYADANRIILGLIVTYPHGIDPQTWDTSWITSNSEVNKLKTADQTLPFLGTVNALDVSNPKAGKEGIAMAFDGATIEANQAQIPLHFTLGAECSLANNACKHTLTYDFTLPFHAGRVLNLHQTVIANGHALTLEKIVITPSETRAYIHWQPGDLTEPAFALPGGRGGPATYTQTLYDLELSAGGQTYPICFIGGGIVCRTGFGPGPYQSANSSFIDKGGSFVGPDLLLGNAPQTIDVSLFQPLYNQHGTWTLTITRFGMPMQKKTQDTYASTGPTAKDDLAKPWVFTFNAP